MGSSDKTLVLTRRLSLVILIGFIGIAAAPFTTLYTPTYPVNYTHEYDQFFVLSDESPTYDFTPTFADKIMIEELTTNGSPLSSIYMRTATLRIPVQSYRMLLRLETSFWWAKD